MSTRIVLRNVRLMFQDIFEARKFNEDQKVARYSATVRIEKNTPNAKLIEEAIEKEAEATYGKKAAATLKSFQGNPQKMCYRDGDSTAYENFAGGMLLAAHRREQDGRPDVRDRKKEKIAASDGLIYPGCYINLYADIYAQAGQNAGIRCGLMAVQHVSAGEALGGSKRINDDDFEDLSDESEELV